MLEKGHVCLHSSKSIGALPPHPQKTLMMITHQITKLLDGWIKIEETTFLFLDPLCCKKSAKFTLITEPVSECW